MERESALVHLWFDLTPSVVTDGTFPLAAFVFQTARDGARVFAGLPNADVVIERLFCPWAPPRRTRARWPGQAGHRHDAIVRLTWTGPPSAREVRRRREGGANGVGPDRGPLAADPRVSG